MATAAAIPLISFPDDYDDQSEYETPSRGYLADVLVETEDGSRFQLYFVEPARLQQNLTDEARLGRPFFTEQNLIVLPEVTTAAIKAAVRGLWESGQLQQLKPLNGPSGQN